MSRFRNRTIPAHSSSFYLCQGLTRCIGDVMNERSRGRNVRLMLVAINQEGKPEIAEVIFAGQISTIGMTTGKRMLLL
ncbi:hypothetical protein [Arsenophonus endosymbiont of Aleurodicus floccissimus]|uniref:hypothetical protein n=1 Tax=Arsenophonus endosymbiont of Aleurodicus floccissimus TaxID=2152761 RepID=UPI001EE12C24|nr:hypothetical protein [Arsenophonus endosymbiont of Aleurodicus floccissimus]